MPKDSVSTGRNLSEAKPMSNNDFTNVGLFNWWPSGRGYELAQEVKEWLQTFDIDDDDDDDEWEGLGSLFSAENKPMNALEMSKWYQRTGIRRNPAILERDSFLRGREEKYHLWFHENVKVRLTASDFNDDMAEGEAPYINYEITVSYYKDESVSIIDNEPFIPLDYLEERLTEIQNKTFFTDNTGVNGPRGEVDSWELYPFSDTKQVDVFDTERGILIKYPLWFIPEEPFDGIGSLFSSEQEVQS